MSSGEQIDPGYGARVHGRDGELAAAVRALDSGDPVALVFIHGPGGIGKSTLVRAVAGREAGRGRTVRHIDARDVPPTEAGLDEVLAGLGDATRPLLVIDSFELIESHGARLRGEIIPSLPEGAALLVAGRNPPDAGWHEGDWDGRLVPIRLGPLAEPDALRLVEDRGVAPERVPEILAFGRGHPLALDLASRMAIDGAAWAGGEEVPPDELVSGLISRLGEADIAAGHRPTLGVAAIARSTTPALLAAALPEHDASREWAWLSERSFVEPVGEGVALHALLRDAVRADLRRRDPVLEADLRRRIVDHVYAVASASGELSKVLDLSHLIESPGLTWFTWETSANWYVDSPRPEDVARIDALIEAGPEPEPIWSGEEVWRTTRPHFERMPELGVVVRDSRGRIGGWAFGVTTAVDDEELEADPVAGPHLAHARSRRPRGETVIIRDLCDLTGDPLQGLVGMLANALILRASRSNPRYVYIAVNAEIEFARAFFTLAGGERVPELDAVIGPRRLESWLMDFGQGGFLANQRDLVYRELELDPPPRPAGDEVPVTTEEVREALRDLGRPVALAASPLASGEGVEQRAGSVRDLLTGAAERAFGDDPGERQLHEVLIRGYFERQGSHEQAAEALNLPRTTYFRRLGRAIERVAELLVAEDAGR